VHRGGRKLENTQFNPLSVLATGTLKVITGDPGTRVAYRMMMLEARPLRRRSGSDSPSTWTNALRRCRSWPAYTTSMLQDLEHGRPVEIDAVLGAVVEMAEWTGVPVPISQAILSLLRQRSVARS